MELVAGCIRNEQSSRVGRGINEAVTLHATRMLELLLRGRIWIKLKARGFKVQSAEGKLYLFVGINRTSKFSVTQLVEKADRRTAWGFLQRMLEVVPYKVHIILTDKWHPVRRATAEQEHYLFPANALRNDL